MMPLTPLDYPLWTIGSLIYRRTDSSPLATLASSYLAEDVCARLNASLAPRIDSGAFAPFGSPPQ